MLLPPRAYPVREPAAYVPTASPSPDVLPPFPSTIAHSDKDGSGEIEYKEMVAALRSQHGTSSSRSAKRPQKFVPPPSSVPVRPGQMAEAKPSKAPARPRKQEAPAQWDSAASQESPVSVLRDILLQRAQRVIDTFREFDSDNSRTISYKEFEKAMRSLGCEVTDEVETLWNQIDTDGSGEIAYAELLAALNPRCGGGGDGPSADALDPNNKRGAFKYGKHEAEGAEKLIERNTTRDESYAEVEERRKKQRNHSFR